MEKLIDLPNIGDNMKKQLNMINIVNYEDLRNVGSRQAWLAIQKIDPSACLNRLYSLEGAIRRVRWCDLPVEIKKELKEFYINHKL